MKQEMEYHLYFLFEMLYLEKLTFISVHNEEVVCCSRQVDPLAADVKAFLVE